MILVKILFSYRFSLHTRARCYSVVVVPSADRARAWACNTDYCTIQYDDEYRAMIHGGIHHHLTRISDVRCELMQPLYRYRLLDSTVYYYSRNPSIPNGHELGPGPHHIGGPCIHATCRFEIEIRTRPLCHIPCHTVLCALGVWLCTVRSAN